MTQNLEQVQHQLTGVLLTIAILNDKVEVLETAAAAAMGTPTDPLVRLDFMNLSIDSDRRRLDLFESERDGMKETMDAFTEALKANSTWLTTELRALSDRIQDPQFAQTSERRSELKYLTRQKGFQNLKPYNGGTSTQWEEWRFTVMTWIQQEYPKIATLANKLEKLETEPEEPTVEGARVRVGNEELTTEEEWFSEQLWAMLVQKATGPAHTMIVSLDNSPKSRGVRAWYKLMREAKRTHTPHRFTR